jgi:hypothetical protein
MAQYCCLAAVSFQAFLNRLARDGALAFFLLRPILHTI